jgi:diguanylate cyclase (GGDEF)-like protein
LKETGMPSAPVAANEAERLASLRSYEILDTECESSFDEIVALAAKLTGTSTAVVSLVDEDRQWFKAHFGMAARQTPREHAFCAHAILGTELFEVNDASLDARFATNPLVTAGPEIRYYAGVPLVNREGHALGTLCVIDRAPRQMTADQRQALTTLAHTVMTTLDLHRAMRRARADAMTDALTGLPNRPALLDAIDRAIALQRRHGETFALLYLDLDGFKSINDGNGHAVGDQMLREIANTLRAMTRGEDMPARIGGDEFAMLLVKCHDADISAVAERLRAAIARAMRAAQHDVTVSIGAAAFAEAPADAGAALAITDRLMYFAKTSGKDRVSFGHRPPAAPAA